MGAFFRTIWSPNNWNSNNSNANVFMVGGSSSTGRLSGSSVNNTYGVRPVISLKSCVLASGGSGTSSNPYVVGLSDGCAESEGGSSEGSPTSPTLQVNVSNGSGGGTNTVSSGTQVTLTICPYVQNGVVPNVKSFGCDNGVSLSVVGLTSQCYKFKTSAIYSDTVCGISF